jgi:hypothetical protein
MDQKTAVGRIGAQTRAFREKGVLLPSKGSGIPQPCGSLYYFIFSAGNRLAGHHLYSPDQII